MLSISLKDNKSHIYEMNISLLKLWETTWFPLFFALIDSSPILLFFLSFYANNNDKIILYFKVNTLLMAVLIAGFPCFVRLFVMVELLLLLLLLSLFISFSF